MVLSMMLAYGFLTVQNQPQNTQIFKQDQDKGNVEEKHEPCQIYGVNPMYNESIIVVPPCEDSTTENGTPLGDIEKKSVDGTSTP